MCIRIHVCVHACMCVCLHVSGGERLVLADFLKHFLPYSLRQGLSWNLVLANLAILAGHESPVSIFPELGLQTHCGIQLLRRCWWPKFLSSCLCNKDFTNWAISSAPPDPWSQPEVEAVGEKEKWEAGSSPIQIRDLWYFNYYNSVFSVGSPSFLRWADVGYPSCV